MCDKPYVGRTVSPLNIRLNQHRSAFYKVLNHSKSKTFKNFEIFEIDNSNNKDCDLYALGIHLVSDHNCMTKSDFNDNFKILVLENCSPRNIEEKEHLWIHKLKTLRPFGINRQNPFSIPLLNL